MAAVTTAPGIEPRRLGPPTRPARSHAAPIPRRPLGRRHGSAATYRRRRLVRRRARRWARAGRWRTGGRGARGLTPRGPRAPPRLVADPRRRRPPGDTLWSIATAARARRRSACTSSTRWSRPAARRQLLPGETVRLTGVIASRRGVESRAATVVGATVAACAARTAGRTTTRSSTPASPTTAARSGAGASASPAGAATRPTSASTTLPLMVGSAPASTSRSTGPSSPAGSSGPSPAGRRTEPRSTTHRRRARGGARGPQGAEVASERVGLAVLERLRALDPVVVPALRVRLQGLRGPRRLRARGRRAPEDDRAQAASGRRLERPAARAPNQSSRTLSDQDGHGR